MFFFFGERTVVRPSIGLAPIRNNCCGQKRGSGWLETACNVEAASSDIRNVPLFTSVKFSDEP